MRDLSMLTRRFGSLAPYQTCPDFFTAKIETGMPAIEKLKQATLKTLGHSVAGRPIIALEYGPFEPLKDVVSDNLHSSLAASLFPPNQADIFPTSFYGSQRRQTPVLLLQGGIHGSELTGTVASINLCFVLETGKDLRGKPWPRLQALAQATRLLIVPWLNPDATDRWPFYQTMDAPWELLASCIYGVRKNGEPLQYPDFKQYSVINPDDMAHLGSYFNNHGINLQYDLMAIERQPETLAWMRYYLEQKPDAALVWHCNSGSLMGPPEYYLPIGHHHTFSRVAGAVHARLQREGMPHYCQPYAALPGHGKPFMEQSTAIYHVCGALPLMSELPLPHRKLPIDCDTLLDMGLMHIEEVLAFGHYEGFRPYEYWTRVKQQLETPGHA